MMCTVDTNDQNSAILLLRESQITVDYLIDHLKTDMQLRLDQISSLESSLKINSPLSKSKPKTPAQVA